MTKSCTEDYRALDIRKINRAGRLQPGSVCSWEWSRNGNITGSICMKAGFDSLTLDYRQRSHGGEWKDVSYPVRLVYTPCNMGGQRVWWHCPARSCGRRVAVLYGGAGIFACRHCYHLAYRSQKEEKFCGKADKLRARLGWVPGIANLPGDKPKGMHWKTYRLLTTAYYVEAQQAMAGMSLRMGSVVNRLERSSI